MPVTDARRFVEAAALAQPAQHRFAAPAIESDLAVLDDEAYEGARMTAPWPPRPVRAPQVGPSRNAHSRSFNDPSNYLG